MPEPAPEIIMDANGAYWRRYPDHLSMVPVSADNDPLAMPIVVYRPEDQDRVVFLEGELRYMAQRHHETIVGSKYHDPEHIGSFEDCPCKTCQRAATALKEVEPHG